jgi:hypothetical protein
VGPESEESNVKATADQLLNSVSFTGEAANWQVDPDARERYVDRKAEFSFTYPSSHLLDSQPSKNGRLVAVMDVTDPSFIMSDATSTASHS